MAFDAQRGELVLFGGQVSPSPVSNETFAWNGTAWAQRFPAASPIGRQNHELCYDSLRQRVVLHGGQSGFTVLGDTWEWNGTNWSQVVTPASPPARAFPAMVFDGTRTLLFGGGNSASPRNDLWSFNGTAWTQVATANAPPPRYYHSMASNGLGEVLLFGGFEPTSGYTNPTWRFDGTNWAQVNPASSPSARGQATLVFDPVNARYLLWSGSNSFFQALEDTWSYAAGQWTQLTTVRSPSSRARGGAAWFQPQQRLVVYGANYLQNADLRSTPMWEFGSGLASFVRWGPSVCPAIDPPWLRAAASQPTIGSLFRANLESFSWVHGFVVLGLSTTTWSGGPLPFDLQAYGTWPNCLLRVSPDATAYIGFNLSSPWTLQIPNSPGLVGTTLHMQGFTFGAGSFPTNLSTANAATFVIDVQ